MCFLSIKILIIIVDERTFFFKKKISLLSKYLEIIGWI